MSVGGVYAGLLGSLNSDLYPWALLSAYQQQRLYDPSFALRQDADFYDKLRRDPRIAHALYYRKLLAAGKTWHLEPASNDPRDVQKASLVEALLKNMQGFALLRFQLTEAIVAGSRWARAFFEARDVELPGVPSRRWIVPAWARDVDKRRMRQYRQEAPVASVEKKWTDAAGTEHASARVEHHADFPWQVHRTGQGWWEDVASNVDGATEAEGPACWLHHVVDDHEGALGYGSGLADDLAVSFWAKSQLLQHGLAFTERWGEGGLLVAELQAMLGGDFAGAEYAARRDALVASLKKSRSEHVVGIAAGDKVTVVEPSGEGYKAILEFIRYLDDGMVQRILFSLLPTGSQGDTGSLARAEEEGNSRTLVTAHDRTLLEETLTVGLVGELCRLNEETFAELGLGGRPTPRFELLSEEEDNPTEQTEIICKLLEKGVPLKQDEVYKRTGFTPPAPEDAVFVLDPATGTVVAKLGSPAKAAAEDAAAQVEVVDPVTGVAGPPLPDTDPALYDPALVAPPASFAARAGERDREEPRHALHSLTINLPAQTTTIQAPPPAPAPAQTINVTLPERQQHVTMQAAPAAVVPAPVVHLHASVAAPSVVNHLPAPVITQAPAPVVNVTTPPAPPAPPPTIVNQITTPAPTVNVTATAAPPTIVNEISAPEVHVTTPAPTVNVHVEPAKRGPSTIEVQRDAAGRITSAEIKEEPRAEGDHDL